MNTALRGWGGPTGDSGSGSVPTFQILPMLSDKLPDLDIVVELLVAKLSQLSASLVSSISVDPCDIHACGLVPIPRTVPSV